MRVVADYYRGLCHLLTDMEVISFLDSLATGQASWVMVELISLVSIQTKRGRYGNSSLKDLEKHHIQGQEMVVL